MAGKFVIKKGTTGKFRFSLVSTNGQIVATSEAYNTKASAMTGIRAVKSLAEDAVVDDRTTAVPAVARKTPAAAAKKAPPAAAVRAGGACGFSTNVSLFGGPPERRGCGQTVPPGDARSASPAVALPAEGSTAALVAADEDGALAQYGPAVIFGGRVAAGSMGNPPSGPIAVSTKGTTSITSSASVQNVGAGPVSAGSIRSTCTASKTGVKGSTSVSRGVVVTATDADGAPKTTVKVPAKPPVNHTVKGKVDTGDTFKAVFNEQKKAKDGTLTVVALHLYLLGPTAVGEVVVAESHCRI
jgi:uncharacterized protein YegP (UPF0339 family)